MFLAEVPSQFPEMTPSPNRYRAAPSHHTRWRREMLAAALQPSAAPGWRRAETLAPLGHAIRQTQELILQSSLEQVLTSCHSGCSSTLTSLPFLSLERALI